MKKYLITAISCLAIFVACKKTGSNGNSSSSTSSIDPTNANAVTSAIKVWHGIIVPGTAPTSTNNANSPVLDTSGSSLTITSYQGGYAIIRPSVISGAVAGYYLEVNGANSYFKVDYSTIVHRPATIQQRPAFIKPQHTFRNGLFRPAGGDSTQNSDSVIVIQLPAGIAPGTFCIDYWAYDYSGNVSNLVTQCITIESLGATDAPDWAGTWKFDSEKDVDLDGAGDLLLDSSWYSVGDSVQAMTDAYNTNSSHEYFGSAYTYNSNRLYCYPNGPITISVDSSYGTLIAGYPASYYYNNENLILSANGAYLDNYKEVNKDWDYGKSSCGDIVYSYDLISQGSDTGGWSYDPSQNKFYAIYDDEDSVNTTEAEAFDVTEKTSNTIILKYNSNPGNSAGETDIRYIKLIKQ